MTALGGACGGAVDRPPGRPTPVRASTGRRFGLRVAAAGAAAGARGSGRRLQQRRDAAAPAARAAAAADSGGDAAVRVRRLRSPRRLHRGLLLPRRRRGRLDGVRGGLQRPRLADQPVRLRHQRPERPGGHDGIDNDCDGFVDNLITCETGLAAGFDQTPATTPRGGPLRQPALPAARRLKAIWYGPTIADSKRITEHMGTRATSSRGRSPEPGGRPAATNVYMTFLSSGTAEDDDGRAVVPTCNGTDFDVTYTNPMPLTASQNVNPCGTGVPTTSPTRRRHARLHGAADDHQGAHQRRLLLLRLRFLQRGVPRLRLPGLQRHVPRHPDVAAVPARAADRVRRERAPHQRQQLVLPGLQLLHELRPRLRLASPSTATRTASRCWTARATRSSSAATSLSQCNERTAAAGPTG